MIERDYLIVGAGAGSAAVAQALRQYDTRGSVTLVGNEAFAPYYRQNLLETVLLGGDAGEKGSTPPLCFPPEWYAEHQIELRLNTVVTQLNLDRRLATLDGGQVIHFRKACLATGSRTLRPRVAGSHLGHIVAARTMRDILALKELAPAAKNIVILGGGFVATEAASALKQLGYTVSIMTRHPHLWHGRLDPETAAWLTDIFVSHDIPIFQETLNGFEGKTVLRNIQTKSGRSIPAGIAVLALGTELNLGLVNNTPLSSLTTPGTPVNELLETDEKGIYAVGDIALYPDLHLGGTRRTPFPEATLQQGAIAGANMTGKKRQRFRALPHHRTRALDLQFDFIGDFRTTPTRYEIEGEHAQRHFTAHYYRGSKRVGTLLCNQPDETIETAKATLLSS